MLFQTLLPITKQTPRAVADAITKGMGESFRPQIAATSLLLVVVSLVGGLLRDSVPEGQTADLLSHIEARIDPAD